MSERKMKIAFVTATSVFSGGDKHLVEFINRLDLTAVEPAILCSGADTYSAILNEKDELGISVKTGFSRKSFLRAWLALRKEHADVVVLITGGVDSFPWYIFLAARFSGARRVHAIYHNFSEVPSHPVRNGNFLSYLIRRAFGYRVRALLGARAIAELTDRSICVSRNLREQLIEAFGFPPERTVAVLNGVNFDFYGAVDSRAADVRRDLGIRPENIVVVSTCRLVPLKGLDILLQALSSLRRDIPCLRWIVVGEGPSGVCLRRAAEQMELSSEVFFVGFKDDVRPYLQAADIFVNSSSASYVECFPFAILEAMASGLPCVGARAGGVPEIISDGEDGFLFAPGSVDDLRTAIKCLASNATQRKCMGEHARERARGEFSLHDCMTRVESILLD